MLSEWQIRGCFAAKELPFLLLIVSNLVVLGIAADTCAEQGTNSAACTAEEDVPVGDALLQLKSERNQAVPETALNAHGEFRFAAAGMKNGVAFVRIPKTGSSTFGLVLWRIAEHLNMTKADSQDVLGLTEQTADPADPKVFVSHGERTSVGGWLQEHMPESRMFSLVRDPVSRCMSTYYHMFGSFLEHEPTDESKVAWLQSDCGWFEETYGGEGLHVCNLWKCTDYQSEYLQPAENSTTDETLASYDMIGMTERFDESLILVGWRLDVPMSELLYFRKKDSNSGCDYVSESHIPLEEESDMVQLAAEGFNAGKDIELMQKVSERMDQLAAEYGPTLEADVKSFQQKLAIVDASCGCSLGFEECIDSVVDSEGW